MTEKALTIRVIQIDRKDKTPATITAILRQLGVPSHLKGYHCLKEAIKEAVDNPSIIHAATKELYPNVAKVTGITTGSVERSMRHAIEYAWAHCEDREALDIIFGNTVSEKKGAPSNSHFISAIADCFEPEE